MDVVQIFDKFGVPVSFCIVMIIMYANERKHQRLERIAFDAKQEKILEKHQLERAEWRADHSKLQENTTEVMKELTKAIYDIRKD